MSRAFTKEPEVPEPRCPEPPGCGGPGSAVGRATAEARVRQPSALARLADSIAYCPNAKCPVVDFDGWGATVLAEEVHGLAYPKDPDGLLCPCFGVAPEEVIAAAREGAPERVRAIVARASSPEARCSSLMASGGSC